MFVGRTIGWLIDWAITSDPYAGPRIGLFVGGLSGTIIGGGAGWLGAGMMLSMVFCSVAGVVAGYVIWKPDPKGFEGHIPAYIGGIVGAFFGLGLAVALIRRRRAGAPANQPDEVSR